MKTSTLFEKHQLETIHNFKKSGQRKVSKCKSPQYGMVVYKTGMCHMLRTLERIKREVNILNSISSSYYPKNYDFLTYSNGAFEIIEEYIDSNSLNDSRYLFNTEANIVDLIIDMIEGLKILWDKNITHRDLKPDNILIRKNMTPVIIDLGIARDNDEESLTKSAQLQGPGTPIYSAPEQIQNKKNSINHRTDFFALGILMAELLIGEHPFNPKITQSGLSIVENILDSNYCLSYGGITPSHGYKRIVDNLLSQQPYMRYRNHYIFKDELLKLKGEQQ